MLFRSIFIEILAATAIVFSFNCVQQIFHRLLLLTAIPELGHGITHQVSDLRKICCEQLGYLVVNPFSCVRRLISFEFLYPGTVLIDKVAYVINQMIITFVDFQRPDQFRNIPSCG